MTRIKTYAFTLKDRLTCIGNSEPLNQFSLTVILLLDLFILSVIFQGLNDHTRQITSPNDYFPYECQSIFIKQDWSQENFLSKLQPLVLSSHNNYSYRKNNLLEHSKTDVMHPECEQFFTKIKQMAANQTLKLLFIDRQDTLKRKKQLTQTLQKTKEAYDTSLLETIADPDTNRNDLPAIKANITANTAGIEHMTEQLHDIENQLNSDPLVVELRKTLNPDVASRQESVEDFKRFEKIYPLKELGWQLLFLLPLFALFYFWSSRSVRKNNRVQTLIASHLLVVATLPILLKVGNLVLDLIPHHLLKNLFELLESLHVIALWHYAVILMAIAAGLFSIFIIQKKVFNQKKIQQKRLMKGACYHCGKHLPADSNMCPFCGKGQFINCHQCLKPTHVSGDYCKNCGANTT